MAEERMEEMEEKEEKESTGSQAYEEEGSRGLSKGLIKILMIVASVLIGIILMVIVSNIVFNMRNKGESKQEEVTWAPGVTPKKDPYQTLKIDQFKLSLNDPTGTNPVFLQFEMAIGYEKNNIKLQTELSDRKFEMRDKILALLASKTYEDVNTPDKIQTLKKEIKNQINTLLIHGLVEEVYIIEFNAIPKQ